MKVLAFDAELCTGCGVCEDVCSETWFKETNPDKSAIHISQDPDQAGRFKALFCHQLGDCVDVCPTSAIYRAKNGVVRIRKKECVGCLACVGFCPILAMYYHEDHLVPFKCVACGKCVDACPADALSIVEVADVEPTETEKWAQRKALEVSA